MIIYSTVPLEYIFEGYEQYKPEFEEVVYEGVHMLVEPLGSYRSKIVRLYSNNPQHYLDPRFQPGNLLHIR
jgi:hypothetical protein